MSQLCKNRIHLGIYNYTNLYILFNLLSFFIFLFSFADVLFSRHQILLGRLLLTSKDLLKELEISLPEIGNLFLDRVLYHGGKHPVCVMLLKVNLNYS